MPAKLAFTYIKKSSTLGEELKRPIQKTQAGDSERSPDELRGTKSMGKAGKTGGQGKFSTGVLGSNL